MSELMWMERAQSAEAKLSTMKDAYEPALERVKEFKKNFGIKERDNGEIIIDFEKLATNLGLEGALELRKVIDDTYNVSGNSGDKPHIKLAV